MKKKDFGTELGPDGSQMRGPWVNDKKHGGFVKEYPQASGKKKEIQQWSNGILDKR